MQSQIVSVFKDRIPVIVGCVIALAPSLAGSRASSQDNSPITVEVEVDEERRGFLGSILSSSRGSLRSSASEVESRLRQHRWLRLSYSNAEATIALTDQRRREVGRKENKKDGSISIEYEYEVRGQVLVGRDRSSIWGETRTTADSTTTPSDSTYFDTAARELADRAISEIAGRIDDLRPDRALAGFSHRQKHKMLVKGDGLEVTDIVPGGPAAKAGLQVGDRIRRVDDENGTGDMDRLIEELWLRPSGARVQIEVERDKLRRTVLLTPLPRSRWFGEGSEESDQTDELRRDRSAEAGGRTGAAVDEKTEARGAVEIVRGMRAADVLAALGEPVRRVSFEGKDLWIYEGLTVTLAAGKVTDVK